MINIFLKKPNAWPISAVTPVSYLLVGGGGSGGVDMAGGGGGGGFFHGSAPQSYFSSGIDYAVTIGAGGASGSKSSPYTAGGQGNDTSLQYSGGEYRAAGGGAGAGQPFTSPRPAGAGFAGGSGGGGSGGGNGPRVAGADDTYPSEPGTPAPLRGQATTPSDQGNDGGDGYQSGSGASGHYHGGGGGGAGAVGGDASGPQTSGPGGNGAPAPAPLGGGPSLVVEVVLVVFMCQVEVVLLVEREVVVLVLSLVELPGLLTLVVEEDLRTCCSRSQFWCWRFWYVKLLYPNVYTISNLQVFQ